MVADITHATGLVARLLPFLGSSSRPRRRTGAALFAANLVPVLGVAALGWSLGEMLLVYFCEAVILAALVPIKIVVAAAHGPRSLWRDTWVTAATGAWIFLGYWVLYMYAIMVMGIANMLEYQRFKPADDDPTAHVKIVLAGAPDAALTLAVVFASPIFHAIVAFLIAELYGFFVHFIGEREHRHGAGRHVRQVGRRLAVLHVALVYGGILLALPLLAFTPVAAAPVMTAAFVITKTWLEIRGHERDHAALASAQTTDV
jgi:hypothetical protein